MLQLNRSQLTSNYMVKTFKPLDEKVWEANRITGNELFSERLKDAGDKVEGVFLSLTQRGERANPKKPGETFGPEFIIAYRNPAGESRKVSLPKYLETMENDFKVAEMAYGAGQFQFRVTVKEMADLTPEEIAKGYSNKKRKFEHAIIAL